MANKNVLINDVEFSWAKLVTPFKNQFGGENYELVITAEADRKAELEAAGLNVKTADDGRIFANLKRKAMKANGEANGAPRVVDATRQPMANPAQIGNGSKGNVILYVYDYTFGGKEGTSASITAVQVTDLVVFEGGSSVDFDVVEASEAGEASPF